MKKPSTICCALALIGICGGQPAAAEGLRLGVQAGIEQWDMDISVPILNRSDRLEPSATPAIGVVGQYLFTAESPTERTMLVGFEAGFSIENVSHTQGFDVADIPVDVEADISWSFDVLWLLGYDFGRVSAVLGGGGSYMGGELTASGAGLSATDENTHLGWKLSPGVEIELSESSALLVRVNYAIYQSKKYTGALNTGISSTNVDIEIAPRLFDVRVGWIYKFGSGGLTGLFGRR